MLLVAPVVLPALVWIALVGGSGGSQGRDAAQHATLRFLAVAALAHLALIIVWNPDYGGQRDWDLFSLAWISTTVWCAGVARAKLDDIDAECGVPAAARRASLAHRGLDLSEHLTLVMALTGDTEI